MSAGTKASYLAESNVRIKREMLDNLRSGKSLLANESILYKYKLAFLSTVFVWVWSYQPLSRKPVKLQKFTLAKISEQRHLIAESILLCCFSAEAFIS